MSGVQQPTTTVAAATAGFYTSTNLGQFNGTSTGGADAFQSLGNVTGGGYNSPLSNEPPDNTPFDIRINRHKLNGGAQIQGGFISTASPVAGATNSAGTNVFTCYFLFNPTEIDLEYSFDTTVTGALNPIFVNGGSSTNTQGLMLNQTQSFTLLFDRTYELWAGSNGVNYDVVPSGGPYTFGVQWDVWAIERLVGIYGQASGQGPSGPPAGSICNVQFGGSDIQNSGTGLWQPTTVPAIPPWINFNGWMTEFQVEYTRFDAKMVPSRAAVSLSFMQVYSQPVTYNTAVDDGGDTDDGTGVTTTATSASQAAVGATENNPGGTGAPTFSSPTENNPGSTGVPTFS